MSKVRAFFEQGGCVVATGQLPCKSAEFGHDVDVVQAVSALFGENALEPTGAVALDVRRGPRGGCAIRMQSLDAQLMRKALDSPGVCYDVAFQSDPPLRYIHKMRDGRHRYFFANLDPRCDGANVTLRGRHKLHAWDPHTGTVRPVEAAQARQGETDITCVSLKLPHNKSVFLVTAGS
jgi:hypothetical protein